MFDLRDVSDVHFVWPMLFWLLVLLPLGWMLYLQGQRRRLRQQAMAFSYTAVAAQLKRQPQIWKRLLMPVSVTLVAVCLIAGLARPVGVAQVPVNSVDMMLVMDISLSMMADDIKPDRMSAAREAAIRFVESLPRDVRIGLEMFAGDNYVLSPPTSRHDEVIAYLRALKKEDLKPRTEIGSALHTALKILTPPAKPNAPNASEWQGPSSPDTTGSDQDTAPQQPVQSVPTPNPNPSGRQPERVIVLLSDGDSHEGYPWDLAAREALGAHVMIHTVGIGSPEGATINYHGMELPVTFSESTLRQIADIAGGSYFRVFNEADFKRVYDQIREKTIHYEEQTVDLGFIAAGAGLLVLLVAQALALRL